VVLFVATSLAIAANHPTTPANQLINRYNIWLYLPSVVLTLRGVYASFRDWRCPYCGRPLSTIYPIPAACPRCKRDIGLYDQ